MHGTFDGDFNLVVCRFVLYSQIKITTFKDDTMKVFILHQMYQIIMIYYFDQSMHFELRSSFIEYNGNTSAIRCYQMH